MSAYTLLARARAFEALEPLRPGLRAHYGGCGASIAAGLSLRHDHGSQCLSDHFQDELRFLGIRSSPSFLAAPEGSGCAEGFIRTLTERCSGGDVRDGGAAAPRADRLQGALRSPLARRAPRQGCRMITASEVSKKPGAVHPVDNALTEGYTIGADDA